MKKRILSALLCLVMILSCCAMAVSADSPEEHVVKTEVTYFEDGSYVVTEIVEYVDNSSSRATTQTKTGKKTESAYNITGNLLYSLTVHGTFNYDGSSAEAIASYYTPAISNSNWDFDSGSCTRSGASVTATATFVYLSFVMTKTMTVTLTCSPTGVLS